MNNSFVEGNKILNGEGSAHLRHKSIIMATPLVLESHTPTYDN